MCKEGASPPGDGCPPEQFRNQLSLDTELLEEKSHFFEWSDGVAHNSLCKPGTESLVQAPKSPRPPVDSVQVL